MFTINCNCGKEHTASLEEFINRAGAINSLPHLLEQYKSIYIVADSTTYELAGKKASEILKSTGHEVKACVLKNPVLPNDTAVGTVLMEMPLHTDLILAVGSGTINDTCRVVSYRLGLTYAILCTAPSMDGYASNISPIIRNNTKETISAHSPTYIISDTDIVKTAPLDMIRAGLGDMAGKYIAIMDWRMAHHFTGEYYCDTVANLVLNATDKCMKLSQSAINQENEAIEAMMAGLVESGLGMAYTKVSRPASGSEHMIAHTWEIMDIENRLFPKLHGLEVAQGTMASKFFYDMLYNSTDDKFIKGLYEEFLPRLSNLNDVYKKAGIYNVVTDKDKFKKGLALAPSFRKRFSILEYLVNNSYYNSFINTVSVETQLLP